MKTVHMDGYLSTAMSQYVGCVLHTELGVLTASVLNTDHKPLLKSNPLHLHTAHQTVQERNLSSTESNSTRVRTFYN